MKCRGAWRDRPCGGRSAGTQTARSRPEDELRLGLEGRSSVRAEDPRGRDEINENTCARPSTIASGEKNVVIGPQLPHPSGTRLRAKGGGGPVLADAIQSRDASFVTPSFLTVGNEGGSTRSTRRFAPFEDYGRTRRTATDTPRGHAHACARRLIALQSHSTWEARSCSSPAATAKPGIRARGGDFAGRGRWARGRENICCLTGGRTVHRGRSRAGPRRVFDLDSGSSLARARVPR